MSDIAIYDPAYGAISNALGQAQTQLAGKDVKGAKATLDAARQLANQAIVEKRNAVALAKARGSTKEALDIHNAGLVIQAVRDTKIRTALDAIDRMLATRSRIPQAVQAPPGAGAFLRIPLSSTIGATNPPWAYLAAGGVAAVQMTARQLPYLEYRVHGFLVTVQQVAAATSDSVTVDSLKAQGSNTILLDEGKYAYDTFEFANVSLNGLRNFVDIKAPNAPILTVNSLSSAAGARAGDTIVIASVIVEILSDDDTRIGSINRHSVRFGKDSAQDFGDYSYIGFKGTPLPGNLQRVPMRPAAADAANTTADPMIYLSAALPSIGITTSTLPFASCKIVGFEVGTPTQSVATDVVTCEDLKVKGGFTLFPQEDEVPVVNYARREGGGLHSMAGLRCYPRLSETNQATATIEIWDGKDGTTAADGVARIPGVNVLVDVTQDDSFGPGVVSSYALEAAMQFLK